jgi:hypothetical protein
MFFLRLTRFWRAGLCRGPLKTRALSDSRWKSASMCLNIQNLTNPPLRSSVCYSGQMREIELAFLLTYDRTMDSAYFLYSWVVPLAKSPTIDSFLPKLCSSMGNNKMEIYFALWFNIFLSCFTFSSLSVKKHFLPTIFGTYIRYKIYLIFENVIFWHVRATKSMGGGVPTLKNMLAISDIRQWSFHSEIGENCVGLKVRFSHVGLDMYDIDI